MRKPANMLFLAMLIAGFGAALVYRYLNAQEAQLAAAREAAIRSASTVDVVVAARTIEVGTKLQAHDLVVVNWPAEAEPEGAIASADAIVGKFARHNFVKFQPIARELLADQRSGLLPMLIDSGKRAMSVRVDKETGVSGFITPNSYVDVFATGTVTEGGNSGREQRSKLILQNVKVMAIGKSIELENDEPVEVPTVTLLVSPQDAEKLTLASQQKPVRLALRHFEDDGSVATPGMSMNQLLANTDNVPEAAVRVARTTRAAAPSMELLLGETLVRVHY